MALNRFSKLPTINLRNTQVLPDLGIIDSSIQRQQKSYDTQAATVSAANQQAAQLNLHGEYANGIKEKLVQDLKAKTNEWSNQDLADPRVKSQVNGYIQNVAADPELNKHIKVASLKQEFDKRTNELKSKGKLNPSQELLRKLPWSEYEKNGTVSNELAEPLYEGQNLIQGRSELVSMIKSSGGSGTKFLNDIAYKTSSKGVDITKLDKAVQAQLHTYANSIYGRQEMDDWKAGILTGEIPKTMKFEDYLIKQIKSTTDNFAHMDYDSDYASAHNKNKENQDKEKKEALTIPSQTIGFEMNSEAVGNRFNSDGNFKNKNAITTSLFGTYFDGSSTFDNSKDKAEYSEYERTVDEIAKKNNLTHKQVVENQQKYQTIPFDLYGAGQGEKLTKTLSGISTSAKITIGGKTTTLADHFRDDRGIDLTTEEGKKALKELQVVGEVKPIKNGLVTGYVIGDAQNQMIIDVSEDVIDKAIRGDAKEQAKAIESLHADALAKVAVGQVGYTLLDDGKGNMRKAKLIPNMSGGQPHVEFVN